MSTAVNKRILKRSLERRLIGGAAWGGVGVGLSRVLVLAASAITARIIGRDAYGELGMVQSTFAMAGIFAGFGMGLTSSRYVATFRDSDPDAAARMIRVASIASWVGGGVMTLVAIVAGPYVAKHALNNPAITSLLQLGAPVLLFASIQGAQAGALSGLQSFRRNALVSVWGAIAACPITIAMCVWLGVYGAVAAFVLSQAVTAAIGSRAVRDEARRYGIILGLRPRRADWNVLVRFSLPAVLGGLLVAPVDWLSNAFVANTSSGYAEIGLFNAANQWRIAILFIPSLIASVVLPLIASAETDNRPSSERALAMKACALALVSGIVVAMPVGVLAPTILRLYGSGFAAGVSALHWLCVSAVISGALNVVGQLIASRERMWIGFGLNAVWATSKLIAAYQMRFDGASGLAKASVVAYSVHTVAVLAYLAMDKGTRGSSRQKSPAAAEIAL